MSYYKTRGRVQRRLNLPLITRYASLTAGESTVKNRRYRGSAGLDPSPARDLEIITRARPPRFNLPLLLAGNRNREEDRHLQKSEREVPHAKSNSD
jgi:hypothetical protein